MDPILKIVQRIEKKLNLDVFLIIMGFVEEHHVKLGLEIWKERMTKVNEEYHRNIYHGFMARTIILGNSLFAFIE